MNADGGVQKSVAPSEGIVGPVGERTLQLDPTAGEARRDLAGLLERSGRESEARRAVAMADRLAEYDRTKSFLLERRRMMARHPELPVLLGELEMTHGSCTCHFFRRFNDRNVPEAEVNLGILNVG